jgi:hypothetical protein
MSASRKPVNCTVDSTSLFQDTLAFFYSSTGDLPPSVAPPFGSDFFLLPMLHFKGDSLFIRYNCEGENQDGKIVHHDDDMGEGCMIRCDETNGTWKQLNSADEKADPVIECYFPEWNTKITWRLESHERYWLLIRMK